MVFIFIFATAGLLIWAAIKPWVGKWVDVSLLCVVLRHGSGIPIDDSGVYRVRENGGAIYPCRHMLMAELEHIKRNGTCGRGVYIQHIALALGHKGSVWGNDWV